MRILVVNEYLNVVGGVETYLQALLPELVVRGHSLALAVSNNRIGTESILPEGDVPTWSAFDMDSSERWKPDVVFANGLADSKLEAQYAKRFPTYLFPHNYYGTCISGNKCHASLGHRTCRRTFGGSCLIAYFPMGCGGKNPFRMWSLYQEQRIKCASLPTYRRILVASKHMQSEYLNHGIAEKNVQVVPLFPTCQKRDSHPPLQRPRSDQLLVVSRFTQLKGVQFIADAVREASQKLNRKLKLRIAGTGPERAVIEDQLIQSGVDYRFMGWLDASEREREMRLSDLLIFPSIWPEPFGLVGIEAGCVGLPAVGFNVGGTEEWLRPGISGEISVGRMTSGGLACAIAKALKSDSHWQSLREGAWKVSEEFTLASHCEQLLETFQVH